LGKVKGRTWRGGRERKCGKRNQSRRLSSKLQKKAIAARWHKQKPNLQNPRKNGKGCKKKKKKKNIKGSAQRKRERDATSCHPGGSRDQYCDGFRKFLDLKTVPSAGRGGKRKPGEKEGGSKEVSIASRYSLGKEVLGGEGKSKYLQSC